MRLINEPTSVSILTTSADTVVHYTLMALFRHNLHPPIKHLLPYSLGPPSSHSPSWSRKSKPSCYSYSLKHSSTSGHRSGDELPQATAGKPYSVTFQSNESSASIGTWLVNLEIQRWQGLNGLSLDSTGVLTGTPKHGGRFWLQVCVAHERLGM